MDEFDVMRTIHDSLEQLGDDERARVLSWIATKYSIKPQIKSSTIEASGEAVDSTFDTFAEFFAAMHPSTDRDKALLGAYWLQVVEGHESINTQSVNGLLKDTGYAVGNITRAFDSLRGERPSPVVQLKKAGTTKQARKTYKVSAFGVAEIERKKSEATHV